MSDVKIVCSSDERYFPLVKGLVLSLLNSGLSASESELAFMNIGCKATSLDWLRYRNVEIKNVPECLGSAFADGELGYHWAQVCRAFLPAIFPEAEVLIWIDADASVQDGAILQCLVQAVRRTPENLFIAPEWHYSYLAMNEELHRRVEALVTYYRPFFGSEVAEVMSMRPLLNSGLFAMHSRHAYWSRWQEELVRIYRGRVPENSMEYHLAEQIALNVIAGNRELVTPIDPICNYVAAWCLPWRDGAGIVRVRFPPCVPIGIVHLVSWRRHAHLYWRSRLLYESGRYLSETEGLELFGKEEWEAGRRALVPHESVSEVRDALEPEQTAGAPANS